MANQNIDLLSQVGFDCANNFDCFRSPAMRVNNTLPQDDLRKVAKAAQRAEEIGFDGLVTMENRHDPFLPLAVAAPVTKKIRLETGIAISFARSPMVVANIGWDLQMAGQGEAADGGTKDGRVLIGIGSQIRPHNEKRFSVPWTPPAPRMREYVEALRAIWQAWKTGEKLDYRGNHYTFTLMTPNFVPEPMAAPAPEVMIAAVGPAMLRVAGEVCDGVRLHGFCTRKYQEETIMANLNLGLEKAGRARQDFEIIGGGFIATGPDAEAVDAMFEWVRMRIGFYGSTPSYWPVLDAHDLGDLGRKLNEMSKRGEWEAMTKEIPDDVVQLFCAVGDYTVIAGEIEKRFGGLSDTVSARMAAAQDGDHEWPSGLVQDIQRIATPFGK
jgi:probable F420-dependent oxidoreductase